MKKSKLFMFFLGVIIGAGIAIGAYFLTKADVTWKQYLEEELIPTATATIASLLMIYFGVNPVLKKVVSTINLFNKATDKVNTTAENGEEMNRSIEQFKREITQQVTEVVEEGVMKVREQAERIKQIEKYASNTEEILRIGFGNTEELVNKGYAAEIAKVGTENEEDET